MIDEPPKTYPIRCRWCAESLVIDVPFDVRVQAGHAECRRGHVTPYRYDGVTVFAEELGIGGLARAASLDPSRGWPRCIAILMPGPGRPSRTWPRRVGSPRIERLPSTPGRSGTRSPAPFPEAPGIRCKSRGDAPGRSSDRSTRARPTLPRSCGAPCPAAPCSRDRAEERVALP